MRGQAALEYLVTYGWAIGVILVVIGAFSYIGFTQADRYIPSSCTIGGDFSCKDFELASNSANFILVNTAREERFIHEINMTYNQLSYECDLGLNTDSELQVLQLGAGSEREIRCNAGYNPGDRVNVNINIDYRVSNDAQAFTRRAQGTIIGQSTEQAASEPIGIDGVCGANARDFNWDDTNWPNDGTKEDFCSQGTLEAEPSFPEQGNSVDWTCEGINGGESPTCTANRGTEPVEEQGACGAINGHEFPAEQEDWDSIQPSNYFCNVGAPEPTPVPFPQERETTNWFCVADTSSPACSASRLAKEVDCKDSEYIAKACSDTDCGLISTDECETIDCGTGHCTEQGQVCGDNNICVPEQCESICPDSSTVQCGDPITPTNDCDEGCEGTGTFCQEGRTCVGNECQDAGIPSCPEPSCDPDGFAPYCDLFGRAVSCEESATKGCFVETYTDCGFDTCVNGFCLGNSDW